MWGDERSVSLFAAGAEGRYYLRNKERMSVSAIATTDYRNRGDTESDALKNQFTAYIQTAFKRERFRYIHTLVRQTEHEVHTYVSEE